MPQNRLVTLLTDFGLKDVYVGVMKGVIAQINPALTVVDITHQISPQNLAAASFNLLNAYPYFPDGTVHIAVVDPGVGSQRRAIAIQLEGGFVVGPDNGILSGVLSQNSVIKVVELTNWKYWLTPTPSSTFHGRDIFAPVGAHLASGVDLAALGEVIAPSTLVKLAIPELRKTPIGIRGCIQYVDRFGNLVTNIPAIEVEGKVWSLALGGRYLPASKTYSDRAVGEVVVLIGSHGWVEIAVNGGSAESLLQLDWGSQVEILTTSTKGES